MNMEAIFAVINTTCSEIRLQKKIQACTGFEPLIKFGLSTESIYVNWPTERVSKVDVSNIKSVSASQMIKG